MPELSSAPIGPKDYGLSLARVSDHVQTSLSDQHAGNRKRAQIMGVHIPDDAFYSDIESRSDASKWINFHQAMERIRDPHCKFVFAWQDSRIFGDELQFITIAGMLRRAGVRLIYQDGREQDVQTREGTLIGLIGGWQNQNEVIRLRQRVRDTHQLKAGRGRLISRAPYGVDAMPLHEAPCGGACKGDYVNCPTWHGELSDNNVVWVVNYDELNHLLLMYQHMASGGSYGELERRLASAGITTRVRTIKRSKTNAGKVIGGMPFRDQDIKRLLKNPFYKGVFTWNKTQIVRDGPNMTRIVQPREQWITHEHSLGPLIPPELWEKANEWIVRKSKTREEQRVYPTLLWDGLIFDGRCGWPMSPRRRANGTKTFGTLGGSEYDYVCHGKHNPYCSCTKHHSISERALDRALGVRLEKARAFPAITATFDIAEEDRTDPAPELRAIGARLQELLDERSNITRMEIRGRLTEQQADQELARITNEETDLRRRQGELSVRPEPARTTTEVPAAVRELLPLLRDERIDIGERRRALVAVVDRVVIDRPHVRFILRDTSQLAQA